MIELTLRRLAQNPRRWLIVTGATFALGLVTLLPLADEYERLQFSAEELSAQLEESRRLAGDLEQLAVQLEAELAELDQVEDRAVAGDQMQAFRAQMVTLVRKSGCRVRRIRTNPATSRPWFDDDDPLVTHASGKNDDDRTGYKLTSQTLTLTVSGGLSQVKQLLAQLHAQKNLAYTKNFSLKPTNAKRTEVELELELWLFDLDTEKSISA